MASNTLSTKANICDAALALLRQDVGYAANTTVAAKCDNVWYVAWDALKNAHGWQTAMGAPSDTPPGDATLRALLVYALARELAIPITGRQEDLKTVSTLFAQKVREAIAADMATAASSLTDTTLGAAMVAVTFAAARDANAVMPSSTAAFLTAGANEKTAAEAEVRSTLGIAASAPLDALANSAVGELVMMHLGAACGLGEGFAQLHAQLYAARIAEWRKVKLNAALAANTDPILAQLLANFKSDDAGLVNAIEVYTHRFATIASASEREVRSQYDLWEDATNTTGTVDDETFRFLAASYQLATHELTLEWAHSQHWFPAYEALVKAKLAIVMGHDANATAAFDAEYRTKLGLGLKIELDEKLNSYAVEATTGNRSAILYQLLPNFKADDTSLLHTFAIYDRRVVAVDEQSSATIRDLLGYAADVTLTGSALEASIALSAAKLAPVVGLDASIVKVMTDRYLQIIEQAKRDALDNIVTAADQAVEPFKSCMAEVKRTLGLTATPVTDALAIAAAKELTAANHGEAYGYDANYAAKRLAAYTAKILQWRKIEVDETMKTNTDPILAQLVANAKGDDQQTVNAFLTYTNRVAAVKTNSENTVKDLLNVTTLTGATADAAIALSVAKLAQACGMDANTVATAMKQYEDILADCRKTALDNEAAAGTSARYVECVDEIKQTLGVTTLDAVGSAAAFHLFRARYGVRAGYDANFQQAEQNACVAAVRQWRKVRLDEAMKANSDPVLALLVSNFSGDDAALVNAFETYTNRIGTVKDTVRDAMLARHHWSFARRTAAFSGTKPADCIRVVRVTDAAGKAVAWSVAGTGITAGSGAATLVYTASCETATWPAVARAAYVAAVAAEIAQTVVGNPETAVQTKAHLDKLAAQRLDEAIVADLNEDGSGSELVREVKNVMKAEFHLGDAELDETATALAERIAQDLDAARLEVLAAHNWNFARVTQRVAAYETPEHAFAFTRPTDALRVSSVRTHDERIIGYTIDGTNVICDEMPASVTYVSDIYEADDFPPLVRRALVYRLASDVAVTLPQRKGDPSVLLTLYREKLAAAATTDARESNPGRNAWGRGSYASAMRGGFPRERARHPFHR